MMSRRKTWLSFAALFFAMLPASSTQNSEPFCTPKTPSKDQPPLPKLDMEAFTVEYRASIIDKKYTMRVKEYYDYVHNKVRLDILKNGLRQGVLFDYADNTYILYKYLNQEETEYKCLIQQLDQAKDDNFDIFGFSKGSGSSPIPHVVSSQDILQFAANQQQEYKGEIMLDGLNVTHWQSCLSWQDVNATFTLDYYFTHPDFKALGATTPRQVPIRAVVKGVINQEGDTEKNFHHIYEYLNLRAFDRLAPETFSLPDFMVCQGESTRWTHDFPSLPDSMSYTLEKVSVESGGDRSPMGEIKVTRVFEDAKRKLVRIDHAGITSISDFSTGVEYIIQPNSCSTRPINPDNVISASEEGGLIKIKDRPEINYLKREFRFTGPKLFREISALAFAGTKPESDEVLEAYVAVNDRRPLGIVVKNSSSGSKTYYNIFKFKKTAYPIHDNQDPFDIRRCADSNKITDFDITLKYDSNYKGNIENWNEAIIYALRDYISEVVGCSVLQISIRDQHITAFGKEIQWSGFFLDATLNVKRAKVEDQLPSQSYDEFIYVLFESIKNGKFNKKMSLDENGDDYFINMIGKSLKSKGSDHLPAGELETPLSKFSHISEFCVTTFGQSQKKRVYNNVYDCANDCLESQAMGCNLFQYSKTSKECTMSMQESLPRLTRTPGCDFYTLKYISHFEKFPGTVLLKTGDVLHREASTVEVCARQCLKETSFKCESFDFCEEDDRCQIYTTHYYDKDSNPSFTEEAISRCVHYSRKSLDDFTSVRWTDLSLPGQIEVEANSLQECAYLCRENCAMFSSCLLDQRLVCKFVQPSVVNDVTYEQDLRCSVHNAPGAISKNSSAKSRAPDTTDTSSSTPEKASRSSSSSSDGYSGRMLVGVGVGMVLTGIGVGVLTIFLLRYFKIWDGF